MNDTVFVSDDSGRGVKAMPLNTPYTNIPLKFTYISTGYSHGAEPRESSGPHL